MRSSMSESKTPATGVLRVSLDMDDDCHLDMTGQMERTFLERTYLFSTLREPDRHRSLVGTCWDDVQKALWASKRMSAFDVLTVESTRTTRNVYDGFPSGAGIVLHDQSTVLYR
jgi:hypothetical protein